MGTMGSGKTTVANLLAKQLQYTLIEENFGDNAFLSRFYHDMNRWAFHSQTFFLMEKISQMFQVKRLLETSNVIQDTPITQDVYSYANAQHMLGHIDTQEWSLYQKIYQSFEPFIPKPDYIIYLETSLSNVVNRISKRGRPFEQHIPQKYLQLLEDLNTQWLKKNKTIPIIRIQTDQINIVSSKIDQKQILHIIRDTLHV
jgi:deoxyadenosine/deoxycytidine kinase